MSLLEISVLQTIGNCCKLRSGLGEDSLCTVGSLRQSCKLLICKRDDIEIVLKVSTLYRNNLNTSTRHVSQKEIPVGIVYSNTLSTLNERNAGITKSFHYRPAESPATNFIDIIIHLDNTEKEVPSGLVSLGAQRTVILKAVKEGETLRWNIVLLPLGSGLKLKNLYQLL
jgi:hypothetical protein